MTSQDSGHFGEIIKKSISAENGNPARYHLNKKTDNVDQSEPYRKMTFGERDKNKPHKIILMVGETGTGKTTLINVMINYMLGVQREDKVWFEITDDQSDRTSAHSQTSRITVYGFYLQESKTDLTIIDTPGYGNTHGIDLDKEIATSFLRLSEFEEGIHEIDAVCLVIMAYQNRLSDRQQSIFDAVQSLFGRDIAENIVLLFTHSTGTHPTNALTAVKEAKIKCAVNDKNQPVFFLFNNHQSEPADEEYETIQEQSWNHSFRGMEQFFKFLDNMKPKTLKMTQDVLKKWKQLEANISNLRSRVQEMEQKQDTLKQTQEALEKNKNDKNFVYDAEVPYKEKINTDPNIAIVPMWCTVCEENCHFPGQWWYKCFPSVMNVNCTVCTKKCEYNKHSKGKKNNVTEKRTCEELKKEYDGKRDDESLVKKLEEELREFEKEKIKLVFEAFHCVEILQIISHNTDSLITLQHIEFLTDKLKEINEPEKAKVLENLKKKKAGEENQGPLENITKD